ncbi:uncharacterized protein LOC144611317 isoform X2 [Rhinoraja longicauda]
MHSHVTGHVGRKWAEESTPWVSELPSAAGSRGHSLRGEWTPGASAPSLRGESWNRDAPSDNSAWLQSRSRTNSVGSRGVDVVSGERAIGRKPRVESGYFSLERAKSDSVHNLCPAGGQRAAEGRGAEPSSSPAPASGLLHLGRLTSSQSSFESETSWGTAASAGSADHRAYRRDYSSLADIPNTKRIGSRETLEQDCKPLAPRARTRSPGREEVERLFGQERRPVAETYREFGPGTAGGSGREATASHRLDEESRTSKVCPRKFQQKETEQEIPQQSFSSLAKSKMRDPPSSAQYDRPDRGLTKQASSFSVTSKDKHRYLTPQHDKVDSKTYSHKDEVKMCTKCTRVASETNKMDNRFPSQEQSAHSGYLRSAAKRDQVESSFPERSPHPAFVRAFSRSDQVDSGTSSLEDQKSYTGYLTRSDRVPVKLNSIEESTSCVGYHKTSLAGDKIRSSSLQQAERGFPTRGNSTPPNKDVYSQTADKQVKTERGYPNRHTSNSLHKDLRQQAANKDSKTDRGVSLRSNADSPRKDASPQMTSRLEKTDRGFSNRSTLNSPNKELCPPPPDKPNKPDLLNFKKGWMSILGDNGEWKKHWFVLTDSSLRYYRDSTAEEANDLDGEIDLRNCSNVSEYQVQRNYGFQIHTKELDYTLSAMTSGIRRNWIEALRKNVRPSSSPDVTKRNSWMKPPPSKASLTDSNKENTFCDAIARRTAMRQEATAAERTWADVQRGSRRTDGHLHQPPSQDCVELAPVQQSLRAQDSAPARLHESARTRSPDLPLPLRTQGCAKVEELQQEQMQRLSERSKWFEAGVPGESPRGEADWSFVPIHIPEPLSKDIELKWQELERIPLRDHRQIPFLCSRPSQSSLSNAGTAGTTERLKKEILSLNAQLDEARKELESFRGQTGRLQGQLCASEDQRKAAPKGYVSQATCERSFREMEESHRKAMEELLRQHNRELERMQQDKDRLLSEETNATIAAIEAVKKAHREELEKETEKLRSTRSIVANSDLERLNKQHQEELQSLQQELQVLSEQYSRKCLEIGCHVKETQLREKDLCRSQRENQELLRQNQELNGQLSDEIARIRELVTRKNQDHTANLPLTGDRGSCELEMLLRVKENEVQNMRKETMCLRDELQTMQWDKKYATDRYNDIFVELSVMKVKTERELGQVKEQLKLALLALKEKESLQNSIAK